MDTFFELIAKNSPLSRKIQERDISIYLQFMEDKVGSRNRLLWTPRLSRDFLEYLRKEPNVKGQRRWADATIRRIFAHLKTWTKWMHSYDLFSLGDPLSELKMVQAAALLQTDRAFDEKEKSRLLDNADALLLIAGRSTDQNRYKNIPRANLPRRKSCRPYRNRAIIYCLIETGMRRQAVCNIMLNGLDITGQKIKTLDKGGIENAYLISRIGMAALLDYIQNERDKDSIDTDSSEFEFLFLPGKNNCKSKNQLSTRSINFIWNRVALSAGLKGKTPHSARHAMGRYIIKQTGNAEAVAKQLHHKNKLYSLEYQRMSDDEMKALLDNRIRFN